MTEPLLRAPPFPWVKPGAAAISRTVPDGGGSGDPARFFALRAALAAARVGGRFWALPAEVPDGAVLIRPGSDDDLAPMLAEAERLGGPIVACVDTAPDEVRFRTVDRNADPWSVLRPGVRLIAPAEDEWCLIAALAGAEVLGHDPAALDRRLDAALLGDVAYRDCFTGTTTNVEAVLPILAEWRRLSEANRRIAAASGIAWWKREQVERFLWTERATPLSFCDDAAEAVAAAGDARIAVWPSRMPEGLAGGGVPLVAIEDGFIRSIGLGSALHPPFSIVADESGIYYDPSGPSDLETLLETAVFPLGLLDRAERLARAIVAQGISKYASEADVTPPAPRTDGRRLVLVAGQVEDDMSVRAAGGDVAGNLDLLIRARTAEPDACILFKPHPDVDAGHRTGGIPDPQALTYADQIVREESMPRLLGRIDGVHVLTSLTGFEALLRGRDVTVHGQPFYAGWGLTRDLAPRVARRTRTLSLAELVAGTLILYPRYLDPETLLPCSPEIMLDRFARQRRPKRSWLIFARQVQGRIAKLLGTTTN